MGNGSGPCICQVPEKATLLLSEANVKNLNMLEKSECGWHKERGTGVSWLKHHEGAGSEELMGSTDLLVCGNTFCFYLCLTHILVQKGQMTKPLQVFSVSFPTRNELRPVQLLNLLGILRSRTTTKSWRRSRKQETSPSSTLLPVLVHSKESKPHLCQQIHFSQ